MHLRYPRDCLRRSSRSSLSSLQYICYIWISPHSFNTSTSRYKFL